MIFNKDSHLVGIWLKAIQDDSNSITLEDVPDLYNLKEVVESLI